MWWNSLIKGKISTESGDKLDFEDKKSIRKDKNTGKRDESIIYELINPNYPDDDYERNYVGNFITILKKHSDYDEWDMNDRITAEVYRGQGVGFKMLKIIQDQISRIGKRKNKP